jgi:hypothetical protein
MIKGVHEATVPIDAMQHPADVDLFECIKGGMVDQFSAPGILQGPPAV